ncbi:putative Zn-dependent peptidase [Novosphingobium sp. PhB165]|uniref:M16 family metallopeptidase n=1 Tax=Novosphingobium sp. PhB165 TaxID=2485105 RepID=UPI001049E07C|nr:pitrilysin family protein [Novosphingobium sp. PhB165]TCM19447.1 putative Zn-dependent peptidase [Novosphingobium sp. PhB165]
MRPVTRTSLLALSAALLLSACATAPSTASSAAPPPVAAAAAPQPASPAALVSKVDIPYETFVLPNGLTTIVHTDRKAPIVGVTLYFHVGSKNEPRGKTGFAHLYEHLFFGGSANVPDFDVPLDAAGSTSSNGSTSYDRTNYVETVPTGALPLAMFLESDRMGHLLPAVTQDKLDKQRGVVQNEKRQGDNQPYGLFEYALNEGLLPIGHPYRHTTIGSMADLDAATLTDVRTWFTDHYGPNNAVLVLSGDIDAASARPLVEKWFGDIPRGPAVAPVSAGPVTLPAPVHREIADQVPMMQLTRNWTGPGLNDPDAPALQVGMDILGGLASSRLDNELVRGQQLAVSVTAYAQVLESVSFLTMAMTVKPGVDRAKANAAFDKVLADFLRDGPTEDEVRRSVVSTLSDQIGGLERVGGFEGKGATLAEGQAYSGDPAKYKHDLAAMAALTPAQVKAAMNTWLSRPVYALDVVPGERTMDGAKLGGWGDEDKTPAPKPDPKRPVAPVPPAPKVAAPPVAPVGALAFPAIERATLSNGIPVALARRTAVPKVVLTMDFDAGYAADALDTPGTQGLMLSMLDQGTTSLDATGIAEAQERLGAGISIDGSLDTSSASLTALTANLGPSLDLLADVVRNPAFAPSEVDRVKAQAQAALSQAQSSPPALARRALGAALYGSHPYAQPSDGLGQADTLAALTPDALRAAHAKWLRPDLARITVVGDVTMDELKPLLERAFGNWQAPTTPAPVKPINAAVAASQPRIVLIDRPHSPQSVILAGRVLPITGRTPDGEPLQLANEVLGGGFLSRLNKDLREEKGWSYGVYSGVTKALGPSAFTLSAPVQSDRTGDAIKSIIADMTAYPATKAITAEEFQRVTDGAIRQLPNLFETNSQVAGAIRQNDRLGRPEDYYVTLAAKYRGIGQPAVAAAATQYLRPQGLVFVIVGDRKVVEPQLKGLGLPIEIQQAPKTDNAAGGDESQ